MDALLIEVETLKNILVSRATGGDSSEVEYGKLREKLIKNEVIKSNLPRFVITCRNLNEFWGHIKQINSTYQGRRDYLKIEFDNILTMIEDGLLTSVDKPLSRNVGMIANDLSPKEKNLPTLFLSHSSKDKFFVRKLAEKLTEYNVNVWIDEVEIKIGDSLIDKISDGVKSSDFLVIVLSHNSIESNWVQKELNMAISREMLGTKIILPILIEKCEIPLFLQDKLYADFTNLEDFDSSFVLLLKAIGYKSLDVPEKRILKKEETKVNVPQTHTLLHKESSKSQPFIQSQLELFEDINITGVDKGKSYNPDPNKILFNVYFVLSHIPSREWVEIFDAERRFPRHSMWRKAWIEDSCIVIHCTLEEIKKYHQADITEDVKNSNSRYREYLKNIEVLQQQKLEREQKESNVLNDALDSLQF